MVPALESMVPELARPVIRVFSYIQEKTGKELRSDEACGTVHPAIAQAACGDSCAADLSVVWEPIWIAQLDG